MPTRSRSPRGQHISPDERRERARQRYCDRVSSGMCACCGQRPPQPGRTQCAACAILTAERSLATYHRRREERVARGICIRCGTFPAKPGRMTCLACLDREKAARERRRALEQTASD